MTQWGAPKVTCENPPNGGEILGIHHKLDQNLTFFFASSFSPRFSHAISLHLLVSFAVRILQTAAPTGRCCPRSWTSASRAANVSRMGPPWTAASMILHAIHAIPMGRSCHKKDPEFGWMYFSFIGNDFMVNPIMFNEIGGAPTMCDHLGWFMAWHFGSLNINIYIYIYTIYIYIYV